MRWFAALLMIGCNGNLTSAEPTTPTPYQPMQWNGGYRDADLGGGMWQVEVKGNAYTTRGTVLSYAYKRANEICVDGFDIVDRAGGASSQTYASSRGGAATIGDGTFANSSTVVTTEEKPNVTLIVRCKLDDGPATMGGLEK